jgi:hypothetical protein
MPAVKLTGFFLTDDGYGWSETHVVNGGSGDPALSTILATFDTVMKDKRRPLLGRDAKYIGCRASYRTETRKIASAVNILNPPLSGTQAVGNQRTETTEQSVAAKLRMGNTAQTAFSDIYLRGLWDQVEEGGQLIFNGAVPAAWKSLADGFVASLIANGYGWEGIDPALTSRGNVTNYVMGEDGRITFTVAVTNAIALPAVGTRVNPRFARINNSKSVLNRSLVCTVESATSLKTVDVVAAAEFTGPGTFVNAVKSFIPYAQAAYWKLAHRKSGRPFGLSRGRARVKALS